MGDWASDSDVETTATASTCDQGSSFDEHSDDEVEDLTLLQTENSVCWVPVAATVWSPPCIAKLVPAQAGPVCQHAGVSRKRSANRIAPKEQSNGRTTIMLKNLPTNYSRNSLVNLLNSQGLEGLCNFIYLPVDFRSGANLGYATINMETCYVAELALQLLNGFNKWDSDKSMEVAWNAPHQGLEELVGFFRNCRSMHDRVPDEYKPILLQSGSRVAMPLPTRRIQEPSFAMHRIFDVCVRQLNKVHGVHPPLVCYFATFCFICSHCPGTMRRFSPFRGLVFVGLGGGAA